jgi:hypothetical protein
MVCALTRSDPRDQRFGKEKKKHMKKLGCIAVMVLIGSTAFAAKHVDQATLQDLQPTNFAPAKKKHQQYDFTVATADRSYQCRTPDSKSTNATDFQVGSTVTFTSSGKSGKIKTVSGKEAKCTITRVADLGTTH